MPGWTQILIVALLVVVLFGRNKISGFMGDLGKGITSFKKGLREGDEQEAPKEVADQSETVVTEENKEKTEA